MTAELLPIVQTHQLSKSDPIPQLLKSMKIHPVECQNKSELPLIRLD